MFALYTVTPFGSNFLERIEDRPFEANRAVVRETS
ncbi:hypothetical protein NB231_14051 [Nitrococcus mobilis Nb-231]|uniref:Uncharacterized protein n=1 Tax=Nitrococcus mobilis Nb-231 TaxID=314278 RepID=A4BV36_9GAMM|nr:hypothetical protein NB231_14051 [Nitrococcus mobilis Nb-231]